ncbi:MAG: DoxX family protein [Candidatus Nitrosotenuis sp.]|nr:MAG: DoxX family protein [Candidatus Nitrosotenuis sp.]
MDAIIRQSKFQDITHFGIRIAIGVIFLVHGSQKFNPGFVGFLTSLGIPAEMQIPIALVEFVPGILLIVGVLTRISSALLAVDMLGAIFLVKHAASLTGERGFEFDLILLAGNLAIIAGGPGRVSLSHILKKVPRFLQ